MPEVPRSLLGARQSMMTEEERAAHDARWRAIVNQNWRDSLRRKPRGGATHEGFIFIESHPAMPGLLKIGISSVSDFERSIGINTTGFRQPLVLKKALPVFMNLKEAEKKTVHAIVSFREPGTREFFRLSLKHASGLIESALDGTDAKKS